MPAFAAFSMIGKDLSAPTTTTTMPTQAPTSRHSAGRHKSTLTTVAASAQLPEPLRLEFTISSSNVSVKDWILHQASTTKSLRHKLQVDRHRPLTSYTMSNDPAAGAELLFPPSRPGVVGHRGALYDALENTRESFQRCAALGCDAVELDVFYLPKDGSLVVFHGGGTDEEPGDLTDYCVNQDGATILDLTYEECQQLEFNTQFAEFACDVHHIKRAKIPTLEQVLRDLQHTQTQVKIELKGPGTVEPTLELVERLNMVHHCQFSSFDHSALKLLRTLRPHTDRHGRYVYRTGALFNDPVPTDFLQQARAIGASEVHLRYDTCTAERIQAIHAAGLSSMAWFRGPIGMQRDVTEKYWDIGNEDETCYQAVVDTGVQQICCNRPDVLVNLLSKNMA